MLKPSIQELMKKVDNRYLLVNLAAQRARDLSNEMDEEGVRLDEKSVKIALDEIAEGKVEYHPGPKPQPVQHEEMLQPTTMESEPEAAPVDEVEITETEDIVEEL